jgi:glutamyl-tRNA synthetase
MLEAASMPQSHPTAPGAYRGRLAPSPTGLLHVGHARTFWIAYQRALRHRGTLVLRSEDLDRARCKPEFDSAIVTDLAWLGVQWQEGVARGGPYGPYHQSERQSLYQAAFDQLRASGTVYPCSCSRRDVLRALQAPHAGDDEPLYPGTCRPLASPHNPRPVQPANAKVNWRFRVPDGEAVCFMDAFFGFQQFVAGRDFGDFVVWRHDGSPSYQLAVVVDDASMHITEVVRGADLLRSTARQLLLYRALGLDVPAFCHCPLVTDASGMRLAKRNDALSLRQLRVQGTRPEDLRVSWCSELNSLGAKRQ